MKSSFRQPVRSTRQILSTGWVRWLSFVVCLASIQLTSPRSATADTNPTEPQPLILENPLEPLPPTVAQTDQESDRRQALTLFSTARMLQKLGESSEALRLYQRAYHYDPGQKVVFREIFLLAAELDRKDEAVRYGLKAVASGCTDPTIVRALGLHLAQQGQFEQAASMYDRLLAAKVSHDIKQVAWWMEAGTMFHLAKQDEKAAEQFVHVLDAIDHPNQFGLTPDQRKAILGNPGVTYSLIAETFFLAKRWDEAVDAFQRQHKASKSKASKSKASNDAALEFAFARVDAAREKPKKALDRLLAILNGKFNDGRLKAHGMAPYHLYAELLETLGRKDELIEQLEQWHTDRPDEPSLGYFLAKQYLQADQFDRAETLYRSLIKKTPTLTGYRNLIDIYRRQQPIDRLLDLLIEVVALAGSLDPLDEQGHAVIEDPKLVDQLFASANKRIASDPKSFDGNACLTMAFIAVATKRFDDVDRFFQRAVDATPKKKGPLLLTWGLSAFFDKRFSKAIDVFQQGIDDKTLTESAADFLYYQAASLTLSQRDDEALVAARKALALQKDSPRILNRIAWIQFHADRLDEAAKTYDDLIERFDSRYDSSEIRQILREARLSLSNVHVLNNQLPQAEQRLEEILDEFPDDIGALNDLGYLWADQGKRLNRAERMIRQAVEGDPENSAYRDSLGWIYYRQKRFDEAVTELEKAIDEEPDPVVLDHLGDAYQAAGKFEKAKQSWMRSLDALRKQNEEENVEQKNIEQENVEKIQKKIDSLPKESG